MSSHLDLDLSTTGKVVAVAVTSLLSRGLVSTCWTVGCHTSPEAPSLHLEKAGRKKEGLATRPAWLQDPSCYVVGGFKFTPANPSDGNVTTEEGPDPPLYLEPGSHLRS